MEAQFPAFDPDEILANMKPATRKMAKYRGAPPAWIIHLNKKRVAEREGKSDAEIKAQWAEKGQTARDGGSAFHRWVQAWLEGTKNEEQVDEGEIRQFYRSLGWLVTQGWRLMFVERQVHDPVSAICGTIDAVFENAKGEFAIVDWKRTDKGISRFGFRNGYPPFDKLKDCNFVKYSLQLTLYKRLLGGTVTHLFIVPIKPNSDKWTPPVRAMTFTDDQINAIFTTEEKRLARARSEHQDPPPAAP